MTNLRSGPVVSVATVVWNDIEGFLTTAQSILRQSYSEIEWVVIDGASTDGTSEAAKKLAHRIDTLVIESDEGIYDAMNKAIERLSGEWTIFLNAGDVFYDNDVVRSFVKAANDNDDVLYGHVVALEDNLVKYHRPEDEYWLGMTFDHQGAFVRTQLYKQFRYNKEYKISGDFDLFSRARIDGASFRPVEWLISCRKPYMEGASSSYSDRFAERISVISRHFPEKPWAEKIGQELANQRLAGNISAETEAELRRLLKQTQDTL